jgi:sugar phosphate isomerase/epimerase
MAREAGLTVENIHLPFDDMNHLWEDTPAGAECFHTLEQCLERCAHEQIPVAVMHAEQGKTPAAMSELGFLRFERLARRAEQLGVKIALENMRRAHQIERAEMLLERLDSPNFGICFDAGHWHARLKEFDWLSRWPERIIALHLHDNLDVVTGEGDDLHWIPGNGTIDWAALMPRLPQRLSVALELEPDPNELPPEAFYSLAYERAQWLEGLRTEVVE